MNATRLSHSHNAGALACHGDRRTRIWLETCRLLEEIQSEYLCDMGKMRNKLRARWDNRDIASITTEEDLPWRDDRLVIADFRCQVVPDEALVEAIRHLRKETFKTRSREVARTTHTSNGTSLLIISCTFFERDELLEKLTRYFKLNVSVTAWFISIRTPSKSSSSSSSSVFLAFFEGFA